MLLTSISRHLGSRRRGGISGSPVWVLVRGGYHPDTIRSTVGVPLRIIFRRQESSPCSEQVVFPAFGKSATLPQDQDVAVELTPDQPGEYQFSCAMGVLKGRLIITAGQPVRPDPIPPRPTGQHRRSSQPQQTGGGRR